MKGRDSPLDPWSMIGLFNISSESRMHAQTRYAARERPPTAFFFFFVGVFFFFYVAMCEMARATQQHLPELTTEGRKQRRATAERAHHLHLLLPGGGRRAQRTGGSRETTARSGGRADLQPP